MTEYTLLIIVFLGTYAKAFLALHLLGVIVGMGSATIADILFFKFLRDFRFSRKEAEVLRTVSDVITIALFLIIGTGLALYLPAMDTLNQSGPFLAKMSIAAIIAVNGILMHKFIAPHMVELSFLEDPREHTHVLHRLRKVAFAMGSISFTSWYSAFFLATLKSYIPPDIRFIQIISVYGSILFMAILTSQIMERILRYRSTHPHPVATIGPVEAPSAPDQDG